MLAAAGAAGDPSWPPQMLRYQRWHCQSSPPGARSCQSGGQCCHCLLASAMQTHPTAQQELASPRPQGIPDGCACHDLHAFIGITDSNHQQTKKKCQSTTLKTSRSQARKEIPSSQEQMIPCHQVQDNAVWNHMLSLQAVAEVQGAVFAHADVSMTASNIRGLSILIRNAFVGTRGFVLRM